MPIRCCWAAVILALRPVTAEQDEIIIQRGDVASEMHFICRGEIDVIDASGKVVKTLKDSDFFGQIGILMVTVAQQVSTQKRCVICSSLHEKISATYCWIILNLLKA